jgi:topoisomerase-4 subunit A
MAAKKPEPKKGVAKKAASKAVVKSKSKSVTKAPTTRDKMLEAGLQFITESMYPLKANSVIEQGLDVYTRDALKVYGSYVVEQRAVADFRDGMKPVHRAVLWSMAGLGLRPSAGHKKSARTVGDAIGKYHPHGDSAAYEAMVTITNTVPPFVDGRGGFGSPDTPASAARYTEAKMSKFAHTFLLDPDYLKVVPYEQNFSNDDQLPLYLPALLPALLFVTNIPAPAYGVKAGNPAFSMPTVAKVIVDMLKGKTYTAQKLSDSLKIYHPYGCLDVSKDSDIEQLMATGAGKVSYAPLTKYDEPKRTIYLQSFVPTTLSGTESIDKTLNKILDLDGVKNAYNSPGKKNKNAGPFGALCEINAQKNTTDERFDEICHSVDNIVKSSVHYRLGVTIRKKDAPNEFRYLDYVTYFNAWIKYRIKLEERLIAYKLKSIGEQLHLQEVYLFAVQNMKELLKILPKALAAKDPEAVLAKALKMPVEDAAIILDRKIRQLAAMEADALKEKIKGLKADIKTLLTEQKNPGERAARDTEARVKAYLKKPDPTQPGLPVNPE